MKKNILAASLFVSGTTLLAAPAHAFLFFFPIPNVSKPPELQRIIDVLEDSKETKAVAYASEDKTFGSKMWVWGQYSGKVTQEEADKAALRTCEQSLEQAKAKVIGGKPLYDFGSKRCELYGFINKTVYTPPPEPKPAVSQVVEEVKDSPVAAKLKELGDLKKQGLITEEEYTEKRKAILSNL